MDNETSTAESSTNYGSDDIVNCSQLLHNFTEIFPVEEWKIKGFFDDADLLAINCHWMKFEPLKPSVHFTLAVIYIIVFISGLLSNSLVIYTIVCSKQMITPSDILLANLALSDILTILMIPIFIFNSFYQGPAIGKLGCSLYGFITGLTGTCSIMSLSVIAFERYLVLSHPLNSDKWPTRSWAYFMTLLAWLYSALFASLPLFGVGKYVPEGYLTGCSFDYMSNDMTTRIFILAFFIGAWIVPMIIIVGSYLSIIRIFAQSRRHVTQLAGNNLAINQPNGNNAEMKIWRNVLGLIIGWTVAWTPYAIVVLIGISGYGHQLTPWSAMVPALFAKLSTCIEPFIYAFNQPRIRREVCRRFRPSVLQTNRPTLVNSYKKRESILSSTGRGRTSNRSTASAPLQ